jgi:hypothetical protein
MAKHQKRAHDQFDIMAAATVTASGQGSAVAAPTACNALMLVLDQTDAQDAAGDKLDVYVDTSYAITASGTTTRFWLPICRFTQTLGNGQNNLHYINVVSTSLGIASELEINNVTLYSLSQGEVVHMLGDTLRARYVVTDGGGAHTFTFSVIGIPM